MLANFLIKILEGFRDHLLLPIETVSFWLADEMPSEFCRKNQDDYRCIREYWSENLFGTAELKPMKSNPFKIASGFSFLCVSIVYKPLFDYWNSGKQVKK